MLTQVGSLFASLPSAAAERRAAAFQQAKRGLQKQQDGEGG